MFPLTTRKKTEVLFVPDWREGNPYLEQLSAALRAEGYTVYFDFYPEGYFKLQKLTRKFLNVGIIHLHWLPREFIGEFFWSTNPIKFGVRLLALFLDMVLCRLKGVKIIWTLHNLVEHESPSPDQEIRVRRLIARCANGIIVHSLEAGEMAKKTYNIKMMNHVIPHGNYINMYKPTDGGAQYLRKKFRINSDDVVVLFFGAVRRYKGLDMLLSAFRSATNERLRLVIAGRPFDEEVRKWVSNAAEGDHRVHLSLGFVPENEVASYFEIANVVVLPFHKTLTSGSAILAMGFGKCLILPESARVWGLPGEAGALYFPDGDEIRLRELISQLPALPISEMGSFNRQVACELKWERIAYYTTKVYRTPNKQVCWKPWHTLLRSA